MLSRLSDMSRNGRTRKVEGGPSVLPRLRRRVSAFARETALSQYFRRGDLTYLARRVSLVLLRGDIDATRRGSSYWLVGATTQVFTHTYLYLFLSSYALANAYRGYGVSVS